MRRGPIAGCCPLYFERWGMSPFFGKVAICRAAGVPDGEGTPAAGAGSEAPVYDLSGRRRVVKPTHGVYIRGGKKVYIK